MSRLRAFLHRWQEPIVWGPVVLVLLLAAFYLIPAVDPRAGVDGWGAVWGMLTVALGVVIASFLTWLICTTYRLELTDRDERELIDRAAGIDRTDASSMPFGWGLPSWQPLAVLALDSARWLLVFYLILTRLVP